MFYYRIVEGFLGDSASISPEHSYEQVDVVNGEIVEVDYKIEEICFSKTIESAFFAISMFLRSGKYYYIYKTSSKPCVDLSNSSIGDFKAGREVRFRKPVEVFYIGKFYVDDYFHHSITNLYDNCNYNDIFFDNDYALDMLNKHYHNMYNEIIQA